jgi:regulator of protease activity HflC (stomatin/prohibitin superfamily)
MESPLQQKMELAPAPPGPQHFDLATRMEQLGMKSDPNPFGCCSCGKCIVVPDNHQAALFFCGQYTGTVKKSGCACVGLFEDVQIISMKKYTLDCNKVKVLDLKGNPVLISGVATYHATSAKKPITDVSNPWPGNLCADGTTSFMELQAQAVLKRVASQYPYEAPDGQPCLLRDTNGIATRLRDDLQQQVKDTGCVIVSFDLTDLSYAPEIAQAMLQRQQAEATVAARKLVVQAAVHIANDAIIGMGELGRTFDKDVEAGIIRSLLTAIVSTQTATPTMAV